ncbi:helix-turn-helix domain-containing protein [bacterium]|nr:helix-turn-helix domain-containing protein [bacterium]
MIAVVPTIDELLRDPSRLDGLDQSTLAALALKAASATALIAARMTAAAPAIRTGARLDPDGDVWLTVDEAALILKHKRRWIYRNAPTLPFVKRLSRKSLVCSKQGIDRWLAARRA